MSATALDCESTALEDEPARSATAIVRTPFYWTSAGAPIFGWLHTRRPGLHYDHAVVIAAPIGHEQLHAHRSVRHLADELARRGFPTLRFDWHGTGDSTGIDEDPRRLDAWRANLRDAVALLKRLMEQAESAESRDVSEGTTCPTIGGPSVSVIGVRLGAALAATTFADDEIENLVLWAPVVNGRTYVREMTAIDRTSEIPPHAVPGAPADLEPAGFILSEETAGEISRINLLKSPFPRCRTLLVARDDQPADQRLIDRLTQDDRDFTFLTGLGYPAMMADPHKSDVPRQAIESIAAWCSASVSAPRTREISTRSNACSRRDATVPFRAEWSPFARRADHSSQTESLVREHAVWIGANPDIFGILSEPAAGVDEGRPTIVLLNAGASSHVGPGRLNVHLARRLAAEGFRALRFDASGLGDSVAVEGAPENATYTATIFRDIDRSLQFLKENACGERFVLAGLCSGAYFAFQTAVASADPALIESVLINPLTYFWRDGMTLGESSDRRILVRNYYFESAIDPRKWIKLLSGRTRIGIGGAARLLSERLGIVRKPRSDNRKAAATVRPPFAHPPVDDLTADLDQAVARGRRLTMFFSEGDPGYGILLGKAGRRAKQLQRTGQLHIEFIPHADHNFSRRAPRQDLIERLVRHWTRSDG